jgi:ribonucleoside-diphosphate reductase alpha chain
MAQSIMDYVFRRLALDYLDFDTRAAYGVYSAEERSRQLETGSYLADESEEVEEELETLAQSAPVTEAPTVEKADSTDGTDPSDVPAGTPTGSPAAAAKAAPAEAHSSAELLEVITGQVSDAPLCMTCGIKMRPAGSCYVCEGCGSTSGCS